MAHRRLHNRVLHESAESGKGLTVDAAAGVIHGVKILGFESANGRRYTEAAMLSAIPLYEGAKVNLDHPSDSDEPRSVADRIGKLTGVHYRSGQGLFGSLHYNPKKPFAKELVYWAERMPECIGLSHNASGKGVEEPDGIFTVHQITEVKSVDLVADPATTRSLSEGIQMGRKTVTKSRRTAEGKAKGRKPAFDEFDLLEGEESDNPTGQEPDKDDIKTTILAILAGEGDDMAKAEKLAELMGGAHTPEADEPEEEDEEEELTEEGDEPMGDEPEEEDEEEDEEAMPTREHRESPEVRKLREQVAKLQQARALDKKQAWVRSLAESKGVRLDRTTLDALMALPSKPLIEGMVGKLAKASKAPRSGWSPLLEGEGFEPQAPSIPKGPEDRANWLRA